MIYNFFLVYSYRISPSKSTGRYVAVKSDTDRNHQPYSLHGPEKTAHMQNWHII